MSGKMYKTSTIREEMFYDECFGLFHVSVIFSLSFYRKLVLCVVYVCVYRYVSTCVNVWPV